MISFLVGGESTPIILGHCSPPAIQQLFAGKTPNESTNKEGQVMLVLKKSLNFAEQGGAFRDALMQLCDMLEPSHVYYFTDEQGSVEQGSQATSSTASSGPSMDYSMQI